MGELSAEDAWKIVEAARDASLREGAANSIAVLDAGGSLLAFLRMDGTFLITVQLSQTKARTALFFGKPTQAMPTEVPYMVGVAAAAGMPVAFVAGGVPVFKDGRLVGAVGVSGSPPDKDHAYAEAGLRGCGFLAGDAQGEDHA
jgi:uncharacterized protein GlcG (DUF336 family)